MDEQTITEQEFMKHILKPGLQQCIEELQALQSKMEEKGYKIGKPETYTYWQRAFLRPIIKEVADVIDERIKENEGEKND